MARVASTRFHRIAAVVVGVAAAMLAAEGMLRLFVTSDGPPLPAVRWDALDLPAITTRQIEEGLGTAHFSAAGARLTGNPPLAAAPTVVIIGDSHVVAREVRDEVTMGAWLERAGRARHIRFNVRQYGWRGASPARYVLVAPEVVARWNPAAVIVAVSDDDFDEHATGVSYPWFRIDSLGNASVVPDPQAQSFVRVPPQSVLMAMLTRRWRQVVLRAPRRVRRLLEPDRPAPVSSPTSNVGVAGGPDPPRDIVPRAVVRALKQSYGDRLMLIYVAQVRVTGGVQPDDAERRMLGACLEERIPCASTRQSMLADREHGRVARGFSTTTLGIGHMNGEGHRLTAATMWKLLQLRPSIMAAR